MTNIATLKPNAPGERRGGRVPGQVNMFTRAMRTAMMMAAEQSKHSKDGSLASYLKYLADEKPELFAPMLSRMIPLQAKVNVGFEVPRIDASMNLDEMVKNFEMKLKNGYRPEPKVIEHNRDEDSEQ